MQRVLREKTLLERKPKLISEQKLRIYSSPRYIALLCVRFSVFDFKNLKYLYDFCSIFL